MLLKSVYQWYGELCVNFILVCYNHKPANKWKLYALTVVTEAYIMLHATTIGVTQHNKICRQLVLQNDLWLSNCAVVIHFGAVSTTWITFFQAKDFQ